MTKTKSFTLHLNNINDEPLIKLILSQPNISEYLRQLVIRDYMEGLKGNN